MSLALYFLYILKLLTYLLGGNDPYGDTKMNFSFINVRSDVNKMCMLV